MRYINRLFTYLLLLTLRIDPLRFQAECRKRRLNLALVFNGYFVLQYISFDWRMRAFVPSGLAFSVPNQEIGFGKRPRENHRSLIPGLQPSFFANPSHRSFSFSSSGLTPRIPRTVYRYF